MRSENPLLVQAVVRGWWFPSSAGFASGTLLGAGLRFEPHVSVRGRVWLDADAGVGLTRAYARVSFDAGAGYEWALSPRFGLGPYGRYGQMVATASNFPSDAKYWAVGAALTVRFPSRPTIARPAPAVAPAPPSSPPSAPTSPPPPPDTDRDGIGDSDDLCPKVPAGATPDPDRPGCPDGDDDDDDVRNHLDECRTVPHGMHPDPARSGCPAPDRDRDSVPDATDACPDTPGSPSPDAKKNGCPGMVRVDAEQISMDRAVFFATNKDRILPRSFPVLRAVADALKATPEIKLVSIEGHADVVGSMEYNQDLSERRAASVRSFLVGQGVAIDRLRSRGWGKTRPIGSNETAAGRALNRRVEFIIVDPPRAAGAHKQEP